jgi:demethylmenaquinone methyltransferase/2-methoxy-6-polyprenyl-1,4-benzoquinol methylase
MTLLEEQIAYYRARAEEYDQWWFRTGRYDRGAEDNAVWFAEQAQVRGALDEFQPTGNVVELACGTGLWTAGLARYASSLTLVDTSPEVMAINTERVSHPRTERILASIFEWQPTRRYNVVFFSFWLSHVPLDRFDEFWRLVERCLEPGGRAFFIDSLYDQRSTARDHRLHGPDATIIDRQLNDGRAFRIVKVFYEPSDLAARLSALGWHADVRGTPTYFLYGSASR